jgi:phosphoribosylanthranilate isomerase
MTRIKICCISSVAEAQTAIDAGAAALGLVSAMPSGPGVIDEDAIARIAATVPPGVASFLLTSALDAATIIAQARRCRPNTIQLVDAVAAGAHAELRDALPGVSIVQVVHVTGPEALAAARAAAPHVDAILLDSGNPGLATKELGGTGRTHDWEVSRAIRDAVPCPIYLAGGLHADNVGAAIRAVRPFGVDVCSGVRRDGALDPARLSSFMAGVAAAGRGLRPGQA